MRRMVTSIVVYGEIYNNPNNLLEWLDFSEGLFRYIPSNLIYIGVKGNGFSGKRVLTYKRTKQKLLNAINNQENFEFISLDSVPDGFITTGFDYDIDTSIVDNQFATFVFVSISSSIIKKHKIDIYNIKNELLKFIKHTRGIIFEMDVIEGPQKFAMDLGNDPDNKTLKVLEEF